MFKLSAMSLISSLLNSPSIVTESAQGTMNNYPAMNKVLHNIPGFLGGDNAPSIEDLEVVNGMQIAHSRL